MTSRSAIIDAALIAVIVFCISLLSLLAARWSVASYNLDRPAVSILGPQIVENISARR